MNRTPLFVGGLFLAVVGAGAIWLGPRLMRHPSRTPVPPVDRIAPDAPAISRGTNDSDLAKGPESDDRARLRRKPKLTVTQLDGAPLPDGAQLEYSGGPDDRGFEGRWVRASGLAWTRIPPSDPDGVVRVRLPTAGPALFVTVRDADGRPAKGIPVEYGFEGLEDETRDDGTVQIQSMPAGVLRVNVGGGVRTASPIRVRMGVDRKAEAVLEPGWAITVHVMDEAGKPIPGAYAAAYGFDGVRTAGEDDMSGVGLNELPDSPVDGLSDRAGAARLMTRIDERLAIFVSAAGYTTTAVRAPLPDPRAPLASDVTARIGKQGVFVGGTLRWATTDSRRPEIRAEPAVLAPIRESIGREDALIDSIRDRRFYGRRSRDD